MKLTKKDLESLVLFNKNQKRIGENPLSPEEYLFYLYGKGFKNLQVKKEKKKLKSIDIPNWAISHNNIPSFVSDHIPVKKNTEYKKEISKQYPIAPVCNKAAYTVLLQSEIKTAGRKL